MLIIAIKQVIQINENDIFTLTAKDEKIIKILDKYAQKKYKFVLTDFGHGLFNKSIVQFLHSKSIKIY